jgi:hypothetical protein
VKARLGPAFPRVTDVTRILILLPAIIVLFLGGCGKKKISKAELREVTSEIVTAAQKISGHKSEVTIRPELQPSKNGTPGKLAADNIYVSLSDASQAGAIAKALDEIARRHELSVRETTSDGIMRFDYVTGGIRTHTIHVVIPLTARSNVAMTHGAAGMRGSRSLLMIWVTTARPPIRCSHSAFRSPFPSCRICRCPPKSPKRLTGGEIK